MEMIEYPNMEKGHSNPNKFVVIYLNYLNKPLYNFSSVVFVQSTKKKVLVDAKKSKKKV